jgi:Tol biopolymer transport system component
VISPDGGTLVYWRSTPTQLVDILYRQLEGDTTSKPIEATPAADISPKFSPDGKWVAYGSNKNGTLQVYVQPFPPTGARYQITSTGGMAPVWSRDGSSIFYVSNGRLQAATIRTSPTFAVTARAPMFEGNYLLNVRGCVSGVRNNASLRRPAWYRDGTCFSLWRLPALPHCTGGLPRR